MDSKEKKGENKFLVGRLLKSVLKWVWWIWLIIVHIFLVLLLVIAIACLIDDDGDKFTILIKNTIAKNCSFDNGSTGKGACPDEHACYLKIDQCPPGQCGVADFCSKVGYKCRDASDFCGTDGNSCYSDNEQCENGCAEVKIVQGTGVGKTIKTSERNVNRRINCKEGKCVLDDVREEKDFDLSNLDKIQKKILKKNKKKKVLVCKKGTHLEKGKCVPDAKTEAKSLFPALTKKQLKKINKTITCKTGAHLEGGKCVPDVKKKKCDSSGTTVCCTDEEYFLGICKCPN